MRSCCHCVFSRYQGSSEPERLLRCMKLTGMAQSDPYRGVCMPPGMHQEAAMRPIELAACCYHYLDNRGSALNRLGGMEVPRKRSADESAVGKGSQNLQSKWTTTLFKSADQESTSAGEV